MSSYVYSKANQQVVSVTSSATKLPSTPLSGRRVLVIQNLSTNPVYIGKSNVTTTGSTRGICLANQYDSFSIALRDSVDLYGIAGSSSDVAVFEAA